MTIIIPLWGKNKGYACPKQSPLWGVAVIVTPTNGKGRMGEKDYRRTIIIILQLTAIDCLQVAEKVTGLSFHPP
ncbi:MAG: hypothetical protein NZ901_04825 [Geminocystis sp.]|nr:hypothetical protein [Geminocystis sp.]HIK37133.1 hypothetical protein [Geminocystis sp. M7585_C2015_104]MCS7147497.1 hypothetical protein [Geminocystis sp.]MCX8077900.1 hypothetical protein [Geminocystis sp.]MDW8115190.1 hypothetical protein [Geminocystis sp.]